MKRNTYERAVLYEEVWNEPMGIVASRYGISDVMLKKICKQLEVPTPPRGYWARLKAGQTPERPKLPDHSGPTILFGKGADPEKEPHPNLEGALEALSEEENASLASASGQLHYKERIRLRQSLKQLKDECDFPERILRVNHPQFFSFCESVSKKSAQRALAATESIA